MRVTSVHFSNIVPVVSFVPNRFKKECGYLLKSEIIKKISDRKFMNTNTLMHTYVYMLMYVTSYRCSEECET